jgi:hypothetical protein
MVRSCRWLYRSWIVVIVGVMIFGLSVGVVAAAVPAAVVAFSGSETFVSLGPAEPLGGEMGRAALSADVATRAVSLAAGDLDGDGVPEIVAGYATATGGLLVVYRAAEPGIVSMLRLPVPPDFLAAGSFDVDEATDIVAAARGGSKLWFAAGDGAGGFGDPTSVALTGRVTSLVAGHVHRYDGLTDLAVGLVGEAGPQLLVFAAPEGAAGATPAVYALPAAAVELAMGHLDEDGWYDLAIATEAGVGILRGHDHFSVALGTPSRLEHLDVGFTPVSLALGDFGTAAPASAAFDIALLGADGQVRVLSPGADGGYARSRTLPLGLSRALAGSGDARLVRTRISTLQADDLLLVDAPGRQVQVLAGDGRWQTAAGELVQVTAATPLATMDADGAVLAVLPARLNGDALDDLVLLVEGAEAPLTMLSTAARTFLLNDKRDHPDANPGDGVCRTSHGLCTLRAAIMEANASAGADEIVCWLSEVRRPSTPYPEITEAVTLRNGDCAVFEIDGTNAGADTDGLRVATGNVTIRDIAITNFGGYALRIDGNDNLVTETIVGTNADGDSGLGNQYGICIDAGRANVVRNNIVAGNTNAGIRIDGGTLARVDRNRIGYWPATGTAMPQGTGILVLDGTSAVIGEIWSARNEIRASKSAAINISRDPIGTTVQANAVGFVAEGSAGLANARAIDVSADQTTIGGALNRGNLIINATEGIVLFNGDQATISHNSIGTPGNGRILGDGIAVSGASDRVTINNNEIDHCGRHGVSIVSNTKVCRPTVQVRDNVIGTNGVHTAVRGNGIDGIMIDRVSCTYIGANHIYHNGRYGVYLEPSASITATVTGNTVLHNGEDGIRIDAVGDGNRILDNAASCNHGHGIYARGSHGELLRNTATADSLTGCLQTTGVYVTGNANVIAGEASSKSEIRGHQGRGLVLLGHRNTVTNYYIHSNRDAGLSVFGRENTIGAAGSDRNVISLNGTGVDFSSHAADNWLVGNFIGTALNGNADGGNGIGVAIHGSGNTIGGYLANQGNRIRWSNGANVLVSGPGATGNEIAGNIISPGNSHGILIGDGASNNTVQENDLAGHDGAAISIESGVGNALYRNTSFTSGGLGIDLAPEGVTLNDMTDSDLGANGLQNYPVLSVVTAGASTTRIQGSLRSKPNVTYALQFYSATACHPSGYGEGETFLGQENVTTDGNGQAGFDVTLPVGGALGKAVSATATGAGGSTSEFSKCTVGRPPSTGVAFTVNRTGDGVDRFIGDGHCDVLVAQGDQCSLRAAVQEANYLVGHDTIILPAGLYQLTLAGLDSTAAAGDLDVTDDLTIIGAGADVTVIESAVADRLFEIRNSAKVTLIGVTVRGGAVATTANGGGILVQSNAHLVLDGVSVQENSTGGSGGGLYSSGAITLTNSAVVSNTATGSTGGGGGLGLLAGQATLINTTVSQNRTGAHGGGLYNILATVRLHNVTVAYNAADTDGNGGDGGGLYSPSGMVTLRNSIVADNTDGSAGGFPFGHADCRGAYLSEGYNLIGDRAKQNNTNPAGCSLSSGTGDSVGGVWMTLPGVPARYLRYNAGLGPPALNGGTTPNHMPVAVAAGLTVDWGNPAAPGSGGTACEPFDQRGQPRAVAGTPTGAARCDRGAVEHAPGFLSIGDATVAEGGMATFAVTLSEPAQITFTVQYSTTDITAVAGLDYTHAAATLTFTPGQTDRTISVRTLTDTYHEDDETFRVRLFSPQYVFLADAEGIGTITDSDPAPSISISDASAPEGDTGSGGVATFTVSLNSPSGKTVTVAYTTVGGTAEEGIDYVGAAGALSFAPGVTSRTIAAQVIGDELREGDETFTVQLSAPVNATLGTPMGTGRIVDDDTPGLSIGDGSRERIASGTSPMTFLVRLSKPSTSEVRVSYATSPGTAQPGVDYVHTSGTLTLAAGEVMQRITVEIIGDEADAPTKTFVIALSAPTGGATIVRAMATGRILGEAASVYLPLVIR